MARDTGFPTHKADRDQSVVENEGLKDDATPGSLTQSKSPVAEIQKNAGIHQDIQSWAKLFLTFLTIVTGVSTSSLSVVGGTRWNSPTSTAGNRLGTARRA